MIKKVIGVLLVACILIQYCIASFAGALDLTDGQTAYNYLMNETYATNIVRKPDNKLPTGFPAKFDLREKGVITPVKNQSPFGTCWGFAAISCAEGSILSKLGTTYAATNFDLSERHLTYFSSMPLQIGSNQDGEGIHLFNGKGSFDLGGYSQTATSIFASGVGAAYEAEFPYRGKNGIIEGEGEDACYSANDDWSIDNSQRFVHHYELIDSNVIKPFVIYEDDSEDPESMVFKGYDSKTISKIKKELMKGHPVTISYYADSYDEESKYYNPLTYAQYTCDAVGASHAVCIVGWDDNIKKEMFKNHSNEEGREADPCFPEGDGAWIIKNSWGSQYSTFPNYGDFGIKDANGKSTGCFYLSFYDLSIDDAESLDFDTIPDKIYTIDQYDYMPVDTVEPWVNDSQKPIDMANVFVAKTNQMVNGLGITTYSDNAKVNFKVYLLDENSVVPTDGSLVINENAKFEHCGYHKYNVKTPVTMFAGQKYAVVARVISDMGDGDYSVLTINSAQNKQAAEKEKNSYYSVAIVNKGESYIYMSALNKWVDLADLIPILSTDDQFKNVVMDNLPIKAFATPLG